MKNRYSVEFAARLKRAAEAKQSRIGQLRRKPVQIDPLHAERTLRQSHRAG